MRRFVRQAALLLPKKVDDYEKGKWTPNNVGWCTQTNAYSVTFTALALGRQVVHKLDAIPHSLQSIRTFSQAWWKEYMSHIFIPIHIYVPFSFHVSLIFLVGDNLWPSSVKRIEVAQSKFLVSFFNSIKATPLCDELNYGFLFFWRLKFSYGLWRFYLTAFLV